MEACGSSQVNITCIWGWNKPGRHIGHWKLKVGVIYVSVVYVFCWKYSDLVINHVHGQRPDKCTLMGYDPFASKKESWKKEKLKEEKKTQWMQGQVLDLFSVSSIFLNTCTAFSFFLLFASLFPLSPHLVSVFLQPLFYLCHSKPLPFFIFFSSGFHSPVDWRPFLVMTHNAVCQSKGSSTCPSYLGFLWQWYN